MHRRWTVGLAVLTLVAWPAGCSGGAPGPMQAPPAPSAATPPAAKPPAAAPVASTPASAAVPQEPPPQARHVNAGFAVAPRGPAPPRTEMPGEAALVWEVIPAPPNPHGPVARDTTITRYVVRKEGRAEIVAERREAVMAGGGALWHLVGRDVPVEVEDCAAPGKLVQRKHKQIVFESLEKKPRRIAPMEEPVRAGEWVRLDLEAMVGPWVEVTIDRFVSACEGRPMGSPYRVVLDLDRGEARTFAIPKGALERYQDLVHDVIVRECGSGGELQAVGAGFHYDAGGNLVVEYGFSEYTAPVCFGGVTHVFVGTYALLPELEAHGRLPEWLRVFLEAHPSRSVSMIAAGHEDATRKAFERLPKVAPRLPRDSDPEPG